MSRTFAVLLVLLAIVAAALVYWMSQQEQGERTFIPLQDPSPTHGVVDALTPTAVPGIEPGPIPESLPLLVREGEDEWGYPRTAIDQVGMLALLHHDRFDDLNRYFDEVMRAVAAEPKKELWETAIAEAFSTADPALEPKLDAWVAHSPDRFGPYLARGELYAARGYSQRGTAIVRDTARGQLDAMSRSLGLARADFERALELEPRSIAARAGLMTVSQADGGADVPALLAAALEVCPTCLSVRVRAMYAMRPRWGGSLDAMRQIANDAQRRVTENARLRVLLGYADWDTCRSQGTDQEEGPFDFAPCERALRHGAHWDFYYARAHMYERAEDRDRQAADVDRVLDQRPFHRLGLSARTRLLGFHRRWIQAADVMLTRLRLDPTSGHRDHAWVTHGLRFECWNAIRRNDRELATQYHDAYQRIAPNDERLGNLLQGIAQMPAPAELEAAERAVQERPDDIEALIALDAMWIRLNRLDDVIAMWDRYIQRHPNDGRAYYERGGTHHHAGNAEQSASDVRRACELDHQPACARLGR